MKTLNLKEESKRKLLGTFLHLTSLMKNNYQGHVLSLVATFLIVSKIVNTFSLVVFDFVCSDIRETYPIRFRTFLDGLALDFQTFRRTLHPEKKNVR